MGKANGTDNAYAEEFLEHAIKLDSAFAAAYSHLALAYIAEGAQYAARPLDEALRLANAVALKALANDPNDADA
jgi:hypothetical protein